MATDQNNILIAGDSESDPIVGLAVLPRFLEAQITISSPAAGSTLGSNSITVSGAVDCDLHVDLAPGGPDPGEPEIQEGIQFVNKVEVRFNSGTYQMATPTGPNGNWKSWTFTGNAGSATNLTIDARVTATHPVATGDTEVATVAVQIDRTGPVLTIATPQEVTKPEPPYTATLQGTASDSPAGVKRVEWRFGTSGAFTAATRTGNNWSASITLPGLGSHAVQVRAVDQLNNATVASKTLVARDATPPTLTVDSPPQNAPVNWAEGGAPVTLQGTARDTQTGVNRVEWALEGQTQFTLATPRAPGDWSSWSANIVLPDPDHQTIIVRARDTVGTPIAIQHRLEIVFPFEPRDPLDVISPASYLDELLGYATLRVKAGGAPVTRALLARTFHQPFDDLPAPAQRLVANQVVQQVRICVEVLRAYLTSRGGTLPAAAAAEYLRAAYTTLLGNLGTSSDELRLARAAAAATRTALAERLGFGLSAARPDELDELTLPLDQISEGVLKELFGLLTTVGASPAKLLTWRRAQLRRLWLQQDDTLRSGPLGVQPIIDPDLVLQTDLRDAVADNPAFSLWQARATWLRDLLSAIEAQRRAVSKQNEAFDAIVTGFVAPLAELTALYEQHEQGLAIAAQLRALQLELPPFLYLMRFRDLVNATVVLDDEWSDVYAILAQVQKLRQQTTWRDEERARSLTLSPDFFKLPETTPGTPPDPIELPRWRATEQARQSWQDTLASRVEQFQLAAQALEVVVAETEAATLPLLRDALVRAIAPNVELADAANRLTQELAIDVKSSGSQPLTRAAQAIETLQGILFGLRTQRLATTPSSPAAGWSLDIRPGYSETDFDEEWRWIGSYATWRAAMFVFGYPENYLLPTLRPATAQTSAFKALIDHLRGRGRLTPLDARTAARQVYHQALKVELGATLPTQLRPADLDLTEELTEADLQARRTQIAGLFNNISAPHLAPVYVQELFFFVPLLLALQLQRSGQYLAALDWLQTIYAYNRPLSQRNIYHGLTLEGTIDSQFHRAPDWLLDGLNPHQIVQVRRNAYTRFTIMTLVRCFLEFADSEFTQDTSESIPRARALYVTALDLLDLPEMQREDSDDNPFPPNPVLLSLRLHADLNLSKLRSGRNIAGIERQVVTFGHTPGSFEGLPGAGGLAQLQPRTLRPTPYRYAVLIERAKQLVTIAQQVEAAFLATLEKRDAEAYNLLRARQDSELARAGVRLQDLRLSEARGGVTLAQLQRERSVSQQQYYQELLAEGLSGKEEAAIRLMEASAALQIGAALLYGAQAIHDGIKTGLSFGLLGSPASSAAQALSTLATASSTGASILQTVASYERRSQEWRFQHNMAHHDVRISNQQIVQAYDHVKVVGQERRIAETQASFAEETANFLANKFTNAELYEWMSGILGQVYSYFLQQSTAVAQLAQSQLAFERQETPPAYIQADYWQAPAETALGGDGAQPDRRGLTGSARLLQDIFQLDQFAFETNKRKLQLTQTFSLAQLAPAEFQRFRETGRLVFNTPLELFDRAFPGQYLRLIKRVRTSIIALIPPLQGVRATLGSSGISRVIVGGDLFQPLTVRRDPELVAFTAPSNATGLFELEPEGELLLPFEGLGVDTTWELQLPRAANAFDFATIADVLLTIEYTALHSSIYRQQVLQQLDRSVSADRVFSLRQEFADQWYDLHNPDQSTTPMQVHLETRRADFAPNVEELRTQQLLLYVARVDGTTFELLVTLRFIPQGQTEALGGTATTVDGIISTRRSNGVGWLPLLNSQAPVGTWELALEDTPALRERFRREEISDIMLVITYGGRTPEWPA